MAEYEVSRTKLVERPKREENVAKVEASGAIHSIYRTIKIGFSRGAFHRCASMFRLGMRHIAEGIDLLF